MRGGSATVVTPDEPAIAAATSTPGRIDVDIKRDLHFSPEDAAALDGLIKGRPHLGVFVSRAWLSGLFAEPPRGCEPSLVLLRDGALLRGIAPVAISSTGRHVRVQLLGGGLGSDRVDLLAARGCEAACADRLVSWCGEAFGRRGYVLELRDVPAESSLWGAVQRANAEQQRPVVFQPREIYTLPYLDLADPSTRLGSVVVGHPKSNDKHRRWLERRGRLRIDVLHDAGEVLPAFESLTSFLHARWSGYGFGSALDQPRMHRFHRHVLPLLLRDGQLRMIRVSSDMRTIAVFYGLAVGKWWGYYLAGYDREWAGRIHLGQLTLSAAIDLAVREGAAEFDFLKGVERVKYMWPVRERSSLDADVYSEHFASQFSRAARATREAAAAFAKSVRGLISTVTRG